MSRTIRENTPNTKASHMRPKGGMTVNGTSSRRLGFKCFCCQTAPGKDRTIERRAIKRSERQSWKKDLHSC